MQQHRDLARVATEFDAWCRTSMRPWFADHVRWDAAVLREWRGEDVDLDGAVPSHLVCAATERLPEIAPAAASYSAMLATPEVLDPFREPTRELPRAGWRPTLPAGPSRDDLAALIAA